MSNESTRATERGKGTLAAIKSAQLSANRLAESLGRMALDTEGFHFAPTKAAVHLSPQGRKVESVELAEEGDAGWVLKLAGGDPEARSSGRTQRFFPCLKRSSAKRARRLSDCRFLPDRLARNPLGSELARRASAGSGL